MGEFSFAQGLTQLLARLLVLAGGRAVHILKFLLNFCPSINRHLVELWEGRFPLLLHYLEEGGPVEQGQWQEWLLKLLSDSLPHTFTSQLPMYSSSSKENVFCVSCVGEVLRQVSSKQVILDTLSSIFLVAAESRRPEEQGACAAAFGLTAKSHLELVLSKLETLQAGQGSKRSSSFFGLLRDRSSQENRLRVMTFIHQCLGQACNSANPKELSEKADMIMEKFLLPCLRDARLESEMVLLSGLSATSSLCTALLSPEAAATELESHEEVIQLCCSILQAEPGTSVTGLCSKQAALHSLTCLLQLPPTISQLARCSLLKAAFITIFSALIEASLTKSENYQVSQPLS